MGLTVTEIARICHEANRALCEAFGDTSQLPWEEAPAWQRDSSEEAVRAVLFGAASTPEQQHESWMASKVASGWVYGPVKNADQRTHPCLVPYSQLPREQQAKDHVFRAIVLSAKPRRRRQAAKNSSLDRYDQHISDEIKDWRTARLNDRASSDIRATSAVDLVRRLIAAALREVEARARRAT